MRAEKALTLAGGSPSMGRGPLLQPSIYVVQLAPAELVSTVGEYNVEMQLVLSVWGCLGAMEKSEAACCF